MSSAEVASKANTYWLNSSAAIACTLPGAFTSASPTAVVSFTALPIAPASSPTKPRPDEERRQPLAAQHLDQGVAGVHADEHQHEQEQRHDRAGVDDDLHRGEERARR